MSEEPVFLKVDHVLAIHRRMISEFGGDPALRDPGLLESAVMMPSARFSGKFVHDGIPSMAGAYLFHLFKNHAFADGNKRTALASAAIFIELSGWRLEATDDELEKVTVGAADSHLTKDEVVEFFRKHCSPG